MGSVPKKFHKFLYEGSTPSFGTNSVVGSNPSTGTKQKFTNLKEFTKLFELEIDGSHNIIFISFVFREYMSIGLDEQTLNLWIRVRVSVLP